MRAFLRARASKTFAERVLDRLPARFRRVCGMPGVDDTEFVDEL